MEKTEIFSQSLHPTHDWLRKIHLAYVPNIEDPRLTKLIQPLLDRFAELGHVVSDPPIPETEVILTSAEFGKPMSWRKGLLFLARRKFGLKRTPVVYTFVTASNAQFNEMMTHFGSALAKQPRDTQDFQFDGLSNTAHRVLIEQGDRGGPILSLQRLLQAQTKSIRVLLAVGDEEIERLYHFDLVGAYPVSEISMGDSFFTDVALRVVTTESTREITDHRVLEDPIPLETWQGLSAPEAMRFAGQELGARNFFTEMVRIEDLVHVPAVNDAVADQYSEGCFATWSPQLNALIATVTGSARPVDKGNIEDKDLAVITGVRSDGLGAEVRHVHGKENDPPSSEAVEMMDMDELLPQVDHETLGGVSRKVPVIRSKLHGHRAVRAYDPNLVEFVPLDAAYYHYLVSCATQAQAVGIKAAFSRAESLLNPDDPRQVAFTVLPGHGLVAVEKWQDDKKPLQLLWEYMDEGKLEIDSHIPQGMMHYENEDDGRMHLRKQEVPL
jgi:hypothetical protein